MKMTFFITFDKINKMTLQISETKQFTRKAFVGIYHSVQLKLAKNMPIVLFPIN